MATRAEAIEYLRGIPGIKEGDNAFFTYELSLKNGRTQLVFFMVLDDLIVMSSPFASKDDITAAKALDMAVIFGVSEIGNFFALRHILFLADLDESEIISSIGLLGARADTLESEIGGDRM